MEPQRDLDFFADASPRELQSVRAAALGPTPQKSIHPFLDASVRCMRYRSFIRWYHGSFSAGARSIRLVSSYVLALLALVSLFLLFCSLGNVEASQDSSFLSRIFVFRQHNLELSVEEARLWQIMTFVDLGLVALSLPMFFTLSQIHRVVPLSRAVSLLTLAATTGQYVMSLSKRLTTGSTECPQEFSRFQLPALLTAFVVIQFSLALVALFIGILAIPLARWYILRSPLFLSGWGGMYEQRSKGRVLLKVCPFDCDGIAPAVIRKNWSIFWRSLKTGRAPVFSPSQYYLPPNQHASVVPPCCPFCTIYIGQVDENLRPHGFGVWTQGWGFRFGEYLSGSWEFGRPVAPFVSRQNQCGSGFTALRFGWVKFDFTSVESMEHVYNAKPLPTLTATSSHGGPEARVTGMTTTNAASNAHFEECLTEDNLRFGLLDVECSTFGKFFRKFPKFVYWRAPEDGILRTASKPELGLNNRLQSFSYLDKEQSSNSRLSRRRSTFFHTAKSSFTAATALYVPGGSVSAARISLENLESQSDSPMDNIADTYQIAISTGEEQENKELRVTLDCSGLCPHGWVQKTRPMARVIEQTEDSNDSTPLSQSTPASRSPTKGAGPGGASPGGGSSESSSVRNRFRPSLNSSEITAMTVEVVETKRSEGYGGVPSPFLWTPSHMSLGIPEPRALEIGIRGWKKFGTMNGELEAMLFIHGYKTPLNEAPLLLGQLIALGAFPNRVKPFMYLWPAGTQVWHYYQARRASQHPLCQKGLVTFLRSLHQHGVKYIHVLAHSMGSRLFLKSLKYATQIGLFNKKGKKSATGLSLMNLVFLHPEHYLDDFVEHGDYEAAREVAKHITIYCDSHDEALASAEILSRGRKCMGKHPHGYIRPVEEKSNKASFEWLDLDVIDCTYLDANVHQLRHCFFNINASMVQDIRDMIALRTTALQRHRTLERREGNIYTFRTPPAELSSIFGV